MSKVIIGAVVAAVIVVAGGAVVFLRKDDSPTTTSRSGSSTSSNAESTNGNVFSLSGGGKALACTYTYSGSNGSGEGKMYTDGKGRGLMSTKVETEKGNTGESNVLSLNDDVYAWTVSNGQTFGFKSTKAAYTAPTSASTPTTQSTGASDPNANFDMDCKDWSVDESVLSVPSNVTFTSLPTSVTP